MLFAHYFVSPSVSTSAYPAIRPLVVAENGFISLNEQIWLAWQPQHPERPIHTSI